MSLSAATFRVHRWLGWLIGVQVLIWVTGGVVFSLLPFQSWVKGGDTVKPPTVVLPAGWAERVAPTLQAAAQLGQVAAVAAVVTPQGPALGLSYPSLIMSAWVYVAMAQGNRNAAPRTRGR